MIMPYAWYCRNKKGGMIMFDKLIWYIKQLLPLCYKTDYIENGKAIRCEWRMWFGRCFDIKYL